MLDALPVALRWVVIACMAAAVVVSVVQASRTHRPDERYGIYVNTRASHIGHVAMLMPMLAMSLISPGAIPNTLWQLIFGLIAAAYAVLIGIRIANRAGNAGIQNELAAAAYHLIAALAMVYTTLGAQHMSAMPGMHHNTAPPFPVLGWMLAGLFILDAAGLFAIAVTLRAPGLLTEKLPAAMRIAVFPHLTMDIAMALMIVQTLCATPHIA